MSKTKLSRAKMGRKVAAIQAYPGCKAVKEVAISEVAIQPQTVSGESQSSIVGASKSKRPTTLHGMFKTSFGNNMIC
jgi:hypothetical protein